MTYYNALATPGWKGIDCITVLNPTSAANLKAAGIDYVVRYLGSVTLPEVDAIMGAGLALSLVCYSRAPGWSPSALLGEADGIAAVRNARAVHAIQGQTLWCDLEGWAGGPLVAMDYVNAWAAQVLAQGYEPGLYVGFEPAMLTPAQLYMLGVHRYWHSCSIVPEVANRGYCMVQGRPPNQIIGAVQVDVDTVQKDELGDLPTFMVPQLAAA